MKNPSKHHNKGHLRFATPIKVLIIEPHSEYCRIVWGSAAAGLSHVMIGAVVMSSIIYALQNKDTHAALCTLGCHFFTAEAIMSLTHMCGWSTPMRRKHRLCAHIILQACAIVCITTGTFLVLSSKGVSTSAHGLTGMITTSLVILAAFFGVLTHFRKESYFKLTHVTIGIPTFLVSSICLCFGVGTDVFRTWAGGVAVAIIIGFIIFYSICIIVTSFMECMTAV